MKDYRELGPDEIIKKGHFRSRRIGKVIDPSLAPVKSSYVGRTRNQLYELGVITSTRVFLEKKGGPPLFDGWINLPITSETIKGDRLVRIRGSKNNLAPETGLIIDFWPESPSSHWHYDESVQNGSWALYRKDDAIAPLRITKRRMNPIVSKPLPLP